MDKKTFQLLINADNISPAYLEVILAEAEKYGEIGTKRIYGDWIGTNRRPWKELLAKHSVVPVQASGADSAIIIDALDIIEADAADGVIFAAYDSDFTKLAGKLKGAGKSVIGMGDAVTPSGYRNICDAFIFFDVVRKEADGNVACDGSCDNNSSVECPTTSKAEEAAKEAMEKKETLAGAEEAAAEAVESALTVSVRDVEQFTLELLEKEENSGKILVEKLALLLKQKFPVFSHKKFGYSKFPQFIESIAGLQVVSAAPKYELEHPQMYVVSCERAKDIIECMGGSDAEGTQVLAETKPALSLEEIEAAIIEIIESEEYNGSISLGTLRYMLKGKYPEFDQRMYGRARFNKFMELIPGVRMVMEEVEEEGQAPRMFVVRK